MEPALSWKCAISRILARKYSEEEIDFNGNGGPGRKVVRNWSLELAANHNVQRTYSDPTTQVRTELSTIKPTLQTHFTWN